MPPGKYVLRVHGGADGLRSIHGAVAESGTHESTVDQAR